jgi:hypothetical protein
MKVWISRYWRLVMGAGLLLSFLVISFIGYISIGLYQDSKSFITILKSSNQVSAMQSSKLVADLDKGFELLNFPVIKQLTQIVGLDFTPIQSEITTLTEISPILLGSERPMRYLIAIQNSAEARGTGGILGAYAIVELKKGSLKVIETGSNEPLYGSSLEKIPINVPEEYKRLYGDNPAILQNSNLSPHFPYGAEIWLALWKKEFGQTLDGVIAIDPTALSYILRSTGPITLNSGERITSENLVADTLKNAYERFEKDNKARKQYLVDIMNATVKQLNSGDYSKIKMAQAIRDGIIANRILFYSTDKSAQSELSKVRLGGDMRLESNNEFRTVIQNIDAGKLDYYLDRDVVIESKSCEKIRETQVRIRVTNTLKTGVGVSPYVLTRADKGKPASLIPGSHRFKVFIYGPTDAKLVSVSRENRTANLGGGSTERGRPIYVADVDLAPGESEELLANFSGGVGSITFLDQPLVLQTKLSIQDKC